MGCGFSADALSVEVAGGGQSKFKSLVPFRCPVGVSKHSVECSTRLIGAGPQSEQNFGDGTNTGEGFHMSVEA